MAKSKRLKINQIRQGMTLWVIYNPAHALKLALVRILAKRQICGNGFMVDFVKLAPYDGPTYGSITDGVFVDPSRQQEGSFGFYRRKPTITNTVSKSFRNEVMSFLQKETDKTLNAVDLHDLSVTGEDIRLSLEKSAKALAKCVALAKEVVIHTEVTYLEREGWHQWDISHTVSTPSGVLVDTTKMGVSTSRVKHAEPMKG